MTSALVLAATVSLTMTGLSASGSPPPDDRHHHHHHHQHPSYSWQQVPTGVDEQYRGLAAVDSRTAWVSGEKGSVLLTTDGGASWQDVSPPGAAGLALRDIEAFSSRHAVTMSIGSGEASRIWATHDGGQSWTETFRNTDPDAFYDCLAFSHDGTGLALSDPVDGQWQFARTTDRGDTWTSFTPRVLPPASTDPAEFGFAASGTCLVSGPGHTYWLGGGGVDVPHVWRSRDGGRTWSVHDTPFRGGPSAGVYSLDFRNPRQGIMVGGDFGAPEDSSDAAGWTFDGGRSWRVSTSPTGGYRSGVAFVPHTSRTAVAVGPTGSDVSFDGGRSWTGFDDTAYDGVHCAHDGSCWASGPHGAVARLLR
jgi:photosystem II stability/assembly factor-like uncharacterized protein